MVISRTKYDVSNEEIALIFREAGFGTVSEIRILGAGEFNSAFAVVADGKTYALKVAANNDAVQIYEKNMMVSEVHWYQVMSEQTDLRVPQVYFTDFTKQIIPTNYFIMEFITGTQKDELQLSPEQREKAEAEIARMIAELHKIRGEQFGYIQSGLYDNWYIAFRHIVENLIRDTELVGQTLPNAEKLLEYIDRHQALLETVPCRLISFDAWDPNFISVSDDPEQPAFVWIDPERCFWGDPVFDFVTMQLGRWKLAEKTAALAAYNEIAEFPVTATRDEVIRYALGLCYLGAIMDSEKYYRYTPELPHWEARIRSADMFYSLGFSMLDE